jgi:hypothetical protein
MWRPDVTVESAEMADGWFARARGEYLEMPGLSLTRLQAQRLWGLDADVCGRVLDVLTQSGFLRRNGDGEYVRRDAA